LAELNQSRRKLNQSVRKKLLEILTDEQKAKLRPAKKRGKKKRKKKTADK